MRNWGKLHYEELYKMLLFVHCCSNAQMKGDEMNRTCSMVEEIRDVYQRIILNWRNMILAELKWLSMGSISFV